MIFLVRGFNPVLTRVGLESLFSELELITWRLGLILDLDPHVLQADFLELDSALYGLEITLPILIFLL